MAFLCGTSIQFLNHQKPSRKCVFKMERIFFVRFIFISCTFQVVVWTLYGVDKIKRLNQIKKTDHKRWWRPDKDRVEYHAVHRNEQERTWTKKNHLKIAFSLFGFYVDDDDDQVTYISLFLSIFYKKNFHIFIPLFILNSFILHLL